ncbi:hypothetical protein, partial [Kribbella albertanoniae]|uniref:hypothetical protein n=1 Tax=Kribbella albertanoniae TaxID=1266829 RepID=UPI0014049D8F
TPTPTPPTPTTPVLLEGLLTISIPPAQRSGGNGGSAPATRAERVEAAGGMRFVITIKTPSGNQEPVVIGLKYGKALQWPLSGNPRGWSCDKAAGTCTATNSAKPEPMTVSFATPSGGSVPDRTFTVSAKTGRFYDDDSRTLEAPPRTDEDLLKITKGPNDADVHHRVLTVAPGPDRPSVTLKISYGSSLQWPIPKNPVGWKCSSSTKTCTSLTPLKPVPLRAVFNVPEGGSASARTYTVSATAGLVSDVDSETLPGVRNDDSLLQILTPSSHDDPNPFVYNRFLKVNGVTDRRVTLDISWGRNLSFLSALDEGWTCSRSTDVRRATCWTDNYRRAFNSEWSAWPGKGTANTVTVHARVGGREDTDSVQIPPPSGSR